MRVASTKTGQIGILALIDRGEHRDDIKCGPRQLLFQRGETDAPAAGAVLFTQFSIRRASISYPTTSKHRANLSATGTPTYPSPITASDVSRPVSRSYIIFFIDTFIDLAITASRLRAHGPAGFVEFQPVPQAAHSTDHACGHPLNEGMIGDRMRNDRPAPTKAYRPISTPHTTVALAPTGGARRTRVVLYCSLREISLRGFLTLVNTHEGPQKNIILADHARIDRHVVLHLYLTAQYHVRGDHDILSDIARRSQHGSVFVGNGICRKE